MKTLKNKNMKSLLSIVLILLGISVNAQNVLTLDEAIKNALNNNHNIRLAQNQVESSANKATIGNAGMLPSVDANAGANVSKSTADMEFAGGIPNIEDAESESMGYNAGLSVSYALYDGFGSYYTYQQLKTQNDIATIQERLTIESTVYQVVSLYYQGVNLKYQVDVANEALKNSNERLERVKSNFDFGKSNSLDVLNAEVDLNNDSTNLVNLEYNLLVLKRNLNLLTGGKETSYEFDSDFELNALLSKEELEKKTKDNNVNVLLAKSNISSAEINKKIQQSFMMPRVMVSGNYGYNHSESNTSIILSQQSLGLTGAVTFAWNLFDGGKKHTQLQNAKIAIESSEIQYDQAIQTVDNDFNIAMDNYIKMKTLYNLSSKNSEVAKRNFDKSRELFFQGLISGLQYREAQLNLLRSQSQVQSTKVNQKMSELELVRLSGDLIKQ